MPNYKYKAQDATGKKLSGTIFAVDEADLYSRLKADNKFLISGKEQLLSLGNKPFKSKQLANFAREIGMLVGAGVSLVRALGIMAREESLTPVESKTYNEILRLVKQGTALSDAMEAQGSLFPPLMINMFRASETSGTIEKTALRMADHYDNDHKLSGKIKSALAYPKVLLALVVIVLLVVMEYVMPKFADLFSLMPEMPFATKLLMAVSTFISERWYFVLMIVAGLWVMWQALKTVPAFMIQVDKLKVHLPSFGRLFQQIYTARFARALCSLYSAGIPIISCLSIARNTIDNSYIESQFDSVIALVRNGGNLSDAIYLVDGFVNKLPSTIGIGEETGSLDTMLENIADTLEYDSEMAINSITTYIEPVMIIVMGVIVVILVVGVIMPIYSSYEYIGQ